MLTRINFPFKYVIITVNYLLTMNSHAIHPFSFNSLFFSRNTAISWRDSHVFFIFQTCDDERENKLTVDIRTMSSCNHSRLNHVNYGHMYLRVDSHIKLHEPTRYFPSEVKTFLILWSHFFFQRTKDLFEFGSAENLMRRRFDFVLQLISNSE